MCTRNSATSICLVAIGILCILPSLLQAQLPNNFGNWRLPKQPQLSRHEPRFEDIYFLNERIGWAINLSGYLYRTTDGGDSWSESKIDINGISPPPRSVTFLDSLHGFIGALTYGADNPMPLLRTTDGGITWEGITEFAGIKPGQGICGLSKVNSQVVYGSGTLNGSTVVAKTTDGGMTWEGIDMSKHATGLVDCWFPTPDSGFVVGNINGNYNVGQAVVLFTSDGGKTWQERYRTTRTGEQGWKIFFRTRTEGYVAVQCMEADKYYLSTTDGGVTWQEHRYATVPNDFGPQGIIFMSQAEGWISGWGSQVWHTADTGKTWELIQFPSAINFNRWRWVNDTLAFAAGLVIYRYTPSGTSDVRNLQPTPAVPSATVHLYPNPASSILYVHLEGLADVADNIVITNLAGQIIKTVKAPDTETRIAIPINELAAGAYFLQLRRNQSKAQRMFVVVR